ncbi:hypothetical protein ABIE45_003303 [Methylobacterium sp. OAE515]
MPRIAGPSLSTGPAPSSPRTSGHPGALRATRRVMRLPLHVLARPPHAVLPGPRSGARDPEPPRRQIRRRRVSGLPASGVPLRVRARLRRPGMTAPGGESAERPADRLPPAMRDRPRAPFGAGGMAQETNTRDAGRRGNPGVGQSTRGIRSPRRPRHRPGMVPSRCRLSRRGVCATSRSCAGLPSGLGRGARASGTRYQCRGLPAVCPPRSGRIRRVRRVGPVTGRRGDISAPAGQTAARSHARHRDTPRTGHAARGDGG